MRRHIDIDDLEDAATFEPIHTGVDSRRESKKRVGARRRKGSRCYKQPYNRKQALTQMNYLLAIKQAPFLRIYECSRCSSWHLTHQPERAHPKSSVK